MRAGKNCEKTHLAYRLTAKIDKRLVLDEEILPKGARGDRPLFVEKELNVEPGRHDVEVEFLPLIHVENGVKISGTLSMEFKTGEYRLVTVDSGTMALVQKP
jgi:hypothetical protein